MNYKKGFTVIEIIVVIGIIAILTVIIFPAVNNIRAKNRDAERVSDISALQLGLSLYYNQNPNDGYPDDIYSTEFSSYVTLDSLYGPGDDERYQYVPLFRESLNNSKCTYYHLGTVLELPSAQIDTADTFDSTVDGDEAMNNYDYCADYSGPGISAPDSDNNNYNVRP